MILYKIICLVNGKAYIGITTLTLEARIAQHFRSVRKGSAYALHRAMRLYGDDAFVWYKLARYKNLDALLAAEKAAITEHRSFVRHWGYNMTLGGEGVFGRIVSAEERAKIAAANKRRVVSAETRAKRSASLRGKPHPHRGHSFSPEARLLISLARRRRTAGPPVPEVAP